MISDAKVSNRIAAYGACYLDYANKSITATTFGEKDCADKEYRNMVYMMWAQSVMKRYRCGCITEEYACAVIAKADPICSKCQCAGAIVNPVTPVTPCNIAPDFTVARTVIASDQQNTIGGPFFIISNTNQWQGSWGNSVGYIVGSDGLFTPVPDGAIVYDQSTTTYWTNTPTLVPGAYLPVMNGAYVDGSLIVSSPYPAVNTLFDRLIKVEAFVDGVWVRLYGPDSEQHYGTPQTYLFDTQPTKMRTSYSIGNCVACPDPNLTYELVSAGGGYNLEVTMAATNGFTPGEIYVEQDGVSSTPQTFGALPDTLTFTGLDGTNPVTLHLINLVAGCAPYVENLGVPALCQGDGYVAFTSDGTAELTVYTTSGHYAIRNRTTQVVTEYNSGTGSSLIPAGSYCLFSSTEGEQYGNMGQVFMTGGCSGIVVNQSYMNVYSAVNLPISNTYDFTANTSIVEMEIDNSASGTIDLSTLPLIRAKIINNTTLTTVLLNPSISIGDPMNLDSDLSGNAFDVATVDAFCNGLSPFATGGVTDISGGTNAAPTAASLAARNAYIAAGNTLITN